MCVQVRAHVLDSLYNFNVNSIDDSSYDIDSPTSCVKSTWWSTLMVLSLGPGIG